MAITNRGTAYGYPIFYFTGPGAIGTISNYSLDVHIYFNYTMQTDEVVIMDLRPKKKTLWSTFNGNLLSQKAILPGSDFATWRLRPGDNDVSIFIDNSSASLTMEWDTRYLSFDGRSLNSNG